MPAGEEKTEVLCSLTEDEDVKLKAGPDLQLQAK